MSRNRYDRDDDDGGYYGGGGGRGGWGGDDRYNPAEQPQRPPSTSRADYPRGRDYGYDDSYGGARGSSPRSGRDYESGNYGSYGGRGDAGREDYRDYGRRYGGGGHIDERDYRDYDRMAERPYFEEARDDARGLRAPARGRRASRSRLRCRDIMTRDVTVATRESTLEAVARMMKDEDTGIIPVIELDETPALADDAPLADAPRVGNKLRSSGKLVGLITDRDIVIRAVAEGRDAKTTRAEEVMTTDVHSVKPNDRVIDAIRKMGDKQVRRIAVVGENGNLRGIISMADIALETEEDEELADALEEISSGASFWNKIFG
ncbi:MAG TPA: CBS domain-containing protein [Pyrinomonadaceae bacterium]|jgi:CBS domain-containing protein